MRILTKMGKSCATIAWHQTHRKRWKRLRQTNEWTNEKSQVKRTDYYTILQCPMTISLVNDSKCSRIKMHIITLFCNVNEREHKKQIQKESTENGLFDTKDHNTLRKLLHTFVYLITNQHEYNQY